MDELKKMSKPPMTSEGWTAATVHGRSSSTGVSSKVRLPAVGATSKSSLPSGLHIVLEGLGQLVTPAACVPLKLESSRVMKSQTEVSLPTVPTKPAPLKPAILPSLGTTQALSISARPRTERTVKDRNTTRARQTSLKTAGGQVAVHENVSVGGGSARSESVLHDDASDRRSQASSLSSVHELVEEARRIASAVDEINPKMLAKKAAPNADETSKPSAVNGVNLPHMEQSEDRAPRKSKRTVDEIIATLHDQSNALSESDKKIQEIMGGLLFHTAAVSGNNETSHHAQELTDDVPTVFPKMSESDAVSSLGDSLQSSHAHLSRSDVNDGDNTDADLYGEEQLIEEALMQLSAIAEAESKQADMESVHKMLADEQVQRTSEADSVPVDLDQLWQDLTAPVEVTNEDIISIVAQPVVLLPRQAQGQITETSNDDSSDASNIRVDSLSLGTWTTSRAVDKSVHHFCLLPNGSQLPHVYRGIWRPYHMGLKDEELDINQENSEGDDILLETMQAQAAERIMDEVRKFEEHFQSTMNESQVPSKSQSPLEIVAKQMIMNERNLNMYWTPAPPKWDLAPAHVKSVLFPEYHGAEYVADGYVVEKVEEEVCSSSSDSEEESIPPPAELQRPKLTQFGSAENIAALARCHESLMVTDAAVEISETVEQEISQMNEESQQCTKDEKQIQKDEAVSVIGVSTEDITGPEKLKKLYQSTLGKPGAPSNDYGRLRRTWSAPSALDMDDDFLLIYQNYESIFSEIASQRNEMENASLHPVVRDQKTDDADEHQCNNLDIPGTDNVALNAVDASTQVDTETIDSISTSRPTRRKKKTKKSVKAKKGKGISATDISSFFSSSPAAPLSCRSSPVPVSRPKKPTDGRRSSIPDKLHFEEYKKSHGYDETVAPVEREWVRDIWNTWFDEVFPPIPPALTPMQPLSTLSHLASSVITERNVPSVTETNEADDQTGRTSASRMTAYPYDVDFPPAPELNVGDIELLEEEVARLSQEIQRCGEHGRAYDFCRRGAIYRRLGNIKDAFKDINYAIELEPGLIDAYWHRHLLNVLLNRRHQAVEDLNMLLQLKKSHVPALKSRGLLYASLGESALAVHSLNMALKYQPNDSTVYLYRAEIYEKAGESLMAMEDYASCSKANPANTDALLKHALHLFDECNWSLAVHDLNSILEVEPLHAEARFYRGRVHAELHQWQAALVDFSAAIHLNPNNAFAFYHRGCLLRKLHPKKALQDFSISLLIDNSYSNISCYLQRGMLYSEMTKPHEAISDLECVVRLDPKASEAFVTLGLINMQQLSNNKSAVKSFTNAVHADPTNTKAYMCRAEAYQRLNDLKNALLDINRVLHLRPDMIQCYVWRGDIIRKMGNLQLAAFCIRQLAELSGAVGQNPMQQAIVHTFLKNYDQAIAVLEEAVQSKPTAALLSMLGKTYMKAGEWDLAVTSLKRAIPLVVPENNESFLEATPPITKKQASKLAKLHYQIGTCQVELNQYFEAHDSFTNALNYNGRHAEAFYWRGVTKLKLDNQKGILDINRSLAIDSDLFQAYLSRAAFYGRQGKYSKAILNCNEAIRLQPNSVRAYLYRGALKYYIQAYRLALHDLDQAIRIDATCRLAFYNRALCRQATNNIPQALKDYSIVLMLGSINDCQCIDNTEGWLTLITLINRCLLYIRLGDFNSALYDSIWASKLSPDDKRIHQTMGFCFHKLGRLQEAVNSFTHALRFDKFFTDARIGRGNAFIDFKHEIGFLYARRDYERVLHYDPTCLTARINLAHCFQVMGKFMQAWHQFTEAISIDPECIPALEGRAIVNLQMSEFFAARQDITAAVAVQPTAELLTNRGVIHQFQKDIASAMRDYQRAIALEPTYSLAYFNAANIYFYNRQFKQAESYYSSALEHNPADEGAYLNRAITRVMLKDSKGAVRDFTSALRLSPHSAHIYFNRANLYASLNMLNEAERDYSKAIELQPDDSLALMRRAEVKGRMGQRKAALDDYRLAIDIQSRPIVRQTTKSSQTT